MFRCCAFVESFAADVVVAVVAVTVVVVASVAWRDTFHLSPTELRIDRFSLNAAAVAVAVKHCVIQLREIDGLI